MLQSERWTETPQWKNTLYVFAVHERSGKWLTFEVLSKELFFMQNQRIWEQWVPVTLEPSSCVSFCYYQLLNVKGSLRLVLLFQLPNEAFHCHSFVMKLLIIILVRYFLYSFLLTTCLKNSQVDQFVVLFFSSSVRIRS